MRFTFPVRCWCAALLAALALFAAGPACADLTATYRRGSATFTIELARNGDMRVAGARQLFTDSYTVWRDGEAYLVMAGPGGPVVERVADIAAARAGTAPVAVINEPWVAIAPVTIAGRPGTKYLIRGAEKRPGAMPLVISTDPALVALRDAFQRYVAAQWATSPPDDGPERASMRALLVAGAPIDYLGWQLDTLSDAPIPADRFRLPAEVRPAAEVSAAYAPPKPEPPMTEEHERRQRDRMIKRAIFATGKLWLLTEQGALSTLAPGSLTRHDAVLPGPVADLCRAADAPVILTGSPGKLQLWRAAGGDWQVLATLDTEAKEYVRAMSCSPARIVVLTNTRVILVERRARHSVALAGGAFTSPSVITTPFDAGDALYVGLDQGEWGGGLVRIDLASGAVTTPSASSGRLCAGPLNPGCDPVNGVARAPGKPDCLIVAIGLVHFTPHGRLTEICGDRITRLYYRPYTLETSWPADPPEEPFQTVPFFGLAEAGGTLWAVGGDGLYAIGREGPPRFVKMPAFEDADGVAVSFAIPDLVLVRTGINGHVSVSGAVPMLVPR